MNLEYAMMGFAALAVILSVNANHIAYRARQDAAKTNQRYIELQNADRRTEHLVELELKNGVVGELLLLYAQKTILLREYPNLIPNVNSELARLQTQLNMLNGFNDDAEDNRALSEKALEGNNVVYHQRALTNIRRLRVSLEAELSKELRIYQELLSESKTAESM